VLLPEIDENIVAVLEQLGRIEQDAFIRRQALSTLASLFLSKVKGREPSGLALLRLCAEDDLAVRTDAINLLVLKLYEPETSEGSPGTLAYYRGRFFEEKAMELAKVGAPVDLIVSLIRRKPCLIGPALSYVGSSGDQRILRECFAGEVVPEIEVELEKMLATVDSRSQLIDVAVEFLDRMVRLRDVVVHKLNERGDLPALFPVLKYLPVSEVERVVLELVSAGVEVDQAVEQVLCSLSEEGGASLLIGILRMGADASKLPNVMTAMNKVFSIKEKFNAYRVLSIVVHSIAEDDPLPPPYLRLVIQTLQGFPAIEGYVAGEILPRLCRPAVFDDAVHWRGLCLVLSQLLSSQDAAAKNKACEVCGGMPSAKIGELVGRRKDLKNILREWVVHQPFGTLAELRRILME
jgi:hypothetical protein